MTATLGSVRRFAPLLVLLAGCKGCKDTPSLPADLTALDASVAGVYAGEGVGVGQATVPAFATNAIGAAVVATDLAATGGTLTVDGQGWGTVTATATSAITATSGGFSASGTGWVTTATPPSFENPANAIASMASPPSQLAVAGGGVVWLSGTSVWWAAEEGPAVPVATLPDDIIAIEPVQIDKDGITDLVLWSPTTAVLLRGRDGGGLTFAAGWTAVAGQTIVGCDVQDLDGDGLVDVQVATTNGSGTDVAWMLGDGSGWGLGDVLTADYVTMGIAGEDYTGDGIIEPSLISEDGLLHRYAHVQNGWEVAQSSDISLGMGPGTRLYPSADLNDDGIPEIIAVGPLLDGTGTQALALTAGATSMLTYNFYTADSTRNLPSYAALSFGDLSGDGIPDLALASNLGFLRIAWNANHMTDDGTGTGVASPAFESVVSTEFPTANGVGIGQLSDDGIEDVLLAGDSYVTTLIGAALADDPNTFTDETGQWKGPASRFAVFNLGIAGEPVVEDLNGDGALDFLSFTQNSNGLALQTWHSYPATDTATAGWTNAGGVAVAAAAEPVALAICGETAWALDTEAGSTVLRGFSLDAAGVAGAVLTQANVNGDQLLCGPFVDGTVVAVADHAGSTLTSVTSVGVATSAPLPGPTVGSADTDGDGVMEVVSLPDAGQILAYDDGTGVDALVEATADQVRVNDTGIGRASFGGTPSLSDADGDGVPDVVFQDAGTVWIYRVLDNGGLGLAPPTVFQTVRPVQGAAHFGDVTGDGVPDLMMLGNAEDANFAGTWLVESGA